MASTSPSIELVNLEPEVSEVIELDIPDLQMDDPEMDGLDMPEIVLPAVDDQDFEDFLAAYNVVRDENAWSSEKLGHTSEHRRELASLFNTFDEIFPAHE